jgi:hypothetical protein
MGVLGAQVAWEFRVIVLISPSCREQATLPCTYPICLRHLHPRQELKPKSICNLTSKHLHTCIRHVRCALSYVVPANSASLQQHFTRTRLLSSTHQHQHENRLRSVVIATDHPSCPPAAPYRHSTTPFVNWRWHQIRHYHKTVARAGFRL